MIFLRVIAGNLWSARSIQQVCLQLTQHIRDRSHVMAFGGLIFLILLAVGLVILGIYTLHHAPTLSFIEGDLAFAISTSDVHRLEHLSLGRTFYLRLPEFFTPTAETSWWQMQERVYGILLENDRVSIDLIGMNGEPRRVHARVDFQSLSEVIQRTGIIDFAALLYLVRAISVYQRYQSPRGMLLAFFLSAGAL